MTTMYEKEEKTFPVWLYVTQEKLKMEEGTMLKKVGILANGGDVSGCLLYTSDAADEL